MSADPPGPVLASLSQPCTAASHRICVIADPHVVPNQTGTWKMAHRSEELFSRAIATANRLDPDLTVLAGDLTADGTVASFTRVDELLEALSAPVLTIPGNHDVPKSFDDHTGPQTTFESRYDQLPTVREVGAVDVFALNTAQAADNSLRSTWGGKVGDDSRQWLADMLAETVSPIVVVHHNVGAPADSPGGKFQNFQLQDAPAMSNILTTAEVPLVISAHHHLPAVLTHGVTTEIMSPAVCSYPQAMLTLDIDSHGTTVRLVPLASGEAIVSSRHAAVTGKPLAAGIAEMVDRRIDSLPLYDGRSGTTSGSTQRHSG